MHWFVRGGVEGGGGGGGGGGGVERKSDKFVNLTLFM